MCLPTASPRPKTARSCACDAGFAEGELATLRLSLAATPAQRLEWLEQVLELAWAAGAIDPPRPPAEWSDRGGDAPRRVVTI